MTAGTLMIAGGGTGGHVYPAIAVAREWMSRNADRRVVFVGTSRGLETTIVPKAGFPLELLSVQGLKGKSLGARIRGMLKLPASFFGSWRLISRWQPAAILGVGGYASGPVLFVGALRRRPTMIQEQNAFPGITNKILARVVKQVAVAFPETLGRLGRDGFVTGNPVRHEFFVVRERCPDRSERLRLLVFGGSQGARILNETMCGALEDLAKLKDRLEIVHQTGPRDLERVERCYRDAGFTDARVVAYLDPMADEMGAADLVVARAGALTIGELAAAGRPSVLVPFAAAADNHQEFNARAMERAGGAVVLTEDEVTPAVLAEAIGSLTRDRERLAAMGHAAESLAVPDATTRIVEILERLAGEH